MGGWEVAYSGEFAGRLPSGLVLQASEETRCRLACRGGGEPLVGLAWLGDRKHGDAVDMQQRAVIDPKGDHDPQGNVSWYSPVRPPRMARGTFSET